MNWIDLKIWEFEDVKIWKFGNDHTFACHFHISKFSHLQIPKLNIRLKQ